MRTTFLALLLMACGGEPELGMEASALAQTVDGDPVEPSYTNLCKTVTVTGSVYYNDLRTNGRFDLRDREPGWSSTVVNAGAAPGSEPYGTGDDRNYYGLRDAQVDIYEADVSYGNGASCSALAWQGQTTIGKDGSFAWTGEVCETCGADLDGGQTGKLSLAVKVSLRNCTDDNVRCFSVATPDAGSSTDHFDDDWGGTTWSRWFTGATNTGPRQFKTESVVALGVDRFEISPTGQTAQAANVFAGLVDTTRKVHMLLDAPFGQDEVVAYFPSTSGTHSHESGRLCIADDGAGTWIDGKEMAHEYGHLLHFWRWQNHGKWVSYCYDSDGDGNGDCAESSLEQEYANAAFKEGWGNFVAGVVFDGTGSPRGCDLKTTTRACAGSVCPTGRHYFDDVQVALCDVWDQTVDCQRRDGIDYCDNTHVTFVEILDALEDVWWHADPDDREIVEDATQGDPAILPTFGICPLMEELAPADPALGFALAVSGLDCGV